MHKSPRANRIYWIEALGFCCIIGLSWIDELIGLPGIIWGGVRSGSWHEAVLETCITAVVWLMVYIATRRILKRLRYLEEFPRVCAWCHKIVHDSQWVSIDQYFSQHLDTKPTHGICPECARKLAPSSKTA
jgi:hypothetical protein